MTILMKSTHFEGISEISRNEMLRPQGAKGLMCRKISYKPVICGNLYLISEELCKSLKLKLKVKPQDVGTAAKTVLLKSLTFHQQV